jgi:aldehyde oxidoreductase
VSETINFTVNEKKCSVSQNDNRMLLQYLREDLGLTGTKNGCAKGQCGSCTVLVDRRAKRACITKLSRLNNSAVETIEYGPQDNIISILQNSFISEGAVQCGFCTPGMIMAAKAVLLENETPSEEQIKEGLKNNLCRCTGYVAIIRAVKKAAKNLNKNEQSEPISEYPGNLIGKPVYREDGPDKVSGKAVYADDIYEKNMLLGKIRFADYAHAEIISIDTSEAEKIEGVAYVFTGTDVPGRNKFGITIPQQPVLCLNKVQYEGDMIAAVFAENEEAASAGVRAIKIDYKPLKIINNPEDAKISKIYLNDVENNLAETLNLNKGDTGKLFEECDVIVEGEYEVPFVEHAYLEPEACFAKMYKDVVTVWTPSQDSVHMQESIATSLGLPKEKVRVILSVTGGAFGGKQEPTIQITAALAAMLTGRPVKITLTREESIRVSTKRHGAKIFMKHGAAKNGRLIAIESTTVLDAGAYHSETRWVNFRACVAAGGPYEIPNVKTSAKSYYTNNPPAGAFRGFGSTQVCFAYEIQMDKLAASLNIDPVKIREINAVKNGSETITGQILRNGVGFPETINVIKNRLKELEGKVQISGSGFKLGIGIACSYKNVGIGLGTTDDAGAEVELLENGCFEVRTGSAEMGQGTSSLVAQIVAHELKVPYEEIRVVSCDTALCPQGGVTTASRQTYVTGNAVRIAASDMYTFLKSKYSRDELIPIEGRKIIWQELRSLKEDTCISRVYAPPKTYDYREDGNRNKNSMIEEFDIHYAYCFNTCAVILEVDEKFGKVNVLKIIEAQDAGKVINPRMAVGQVEGAALMGFGYGLTENFIVDQGHVFTNTFNKLHIPKIQELPEIEVHLIEELDENGPYGAKGMGEVPINPVAPAISNAIYNAVGVRLMKLPIKDKDILSALKIIKFSGDN